MEKSEIHSGSWTGKIIKTGKWYLFASLFTKGVGVFLLPLYTTHLLPNEYGLLSTINSIALLLPLFISFSLDSAFGRFFHDFKEDKEKLQELFSTVFWFILFFGILSIFLVLYSSSIWSQSLLGVDPYPILFLAFIPILLSQVGKIGITFLEQSLNSKTTGLIQVIATILKVIAIVPLLLYYHLGIQAVLIGNAVSATCIFSFILFLMWKGGYLNFVFKTDLLKKCLIYSIPLVPGVAFTWINSMVDRLVIAKFDSLEGVGIYAFAFQIGLILYLIGDAITKVVSPMGMSGLLVDKAKTQEKMTSISVVILVVMSIIYFAGILFAEELTVILGNQNYSQAIKLIPLVLIPSLWAIQYRFFVIIISFFKKTWMLTIASVTSGLCNLILNLIFVPDYGFIIGPISTIVSSLLYFLILYIFSQKLMKINFEYLIYFKIISICVFFAFLVNSIFSIQFELDFAKIVIKLFLLIVATKLILTISKINFKHLLINN